MVNMKYIPNGKQARGLAKVSPVKVLDLRTKSEYRIEVTPKATRTTYALTLLEKLHIRRATRLDINYVVDRLA